MKNPAWLVALFVVGCDPETVCVGMCSPPEAVPPTPTPETPAPAPIPAPAPAIEPPAGYPWIWAVRREPMQWSLSCDLSEEMASTVRETAGWWTTLFVAGILAPESPCDSFVDRNRPGLHISFQLDAKSPYGALGGFDPSTGHASVVILKGHYSRLILGIVAMHEIGHALGLGHVEEPGCLMFQGAAKDYGSGLCQIEQAGLAAAYPPGWQEARRN